MEGSGASCWEDGSPECQEKEEQWGSGSCNLRGERKSAGNRDREHSFYTLIWANPENLGEGELKTNFAGEKNFKTS